MSPTRYSVLPRSFKVRFALLALSLAIGGAGAGVAATAESSRKAKAEEFFVVAAGSVDQQALFKTAADAALAKFASAPAAAQQEGRAAIDAMMTSIQTEYHQYFVDAYAKEFTAEELDQLVALMRIAKSPLMAKFQAYQKEFGADSQKVLAELNTRMSARLMERLNLIAAKYATK